METGYVSIPLELDMKWLRERYEDGTLTPEKVMDEIVRRAEKGRENAVWITPPSIAAIKPYLERLRGLRLADAPLWGIPFAVKDNIDLAGVPTTAGCEAFAYVPAEHATVVARLIEAGAIPVGKTNLDQFATGLVGVRSPYGETRNSLRPELISGGSSSGSAVSVALGMAAFSLGTDTAGSGRVPAALNGLVGYKPSLGAWPVKGVVPACASLDCVTVFAGCLDDALLVDSIARGVDAADPWSRSIVRQEPALPTKVLVPAGELAFYGPFADEYRAAWKAAIQRLEQQDIPLEYVDASLFEETAALLYGGPLVAERWAGLGAFIEEHPGVTFPVTETVLRSGAASEYDAAALFKAMHKLQGYKREAGKLLEDAVLVMPTCGGTWTREQVRQDPIAANSDMGRYTNHCNLLDLCAVAIPAGEAAERLPFGITLFALAPNEHLIAGAAVGLSERKGAEVSALALNSVPPLPTDGYVTVAVCGLHMRGFPLERQMQGFRARFVGEAKSAPCYKLVKLPTVPAKPGMIRQEYGGSSIELELWELTTAAFGAFTSLIPAPLGIGKVELDDGRVVSGFVCESYASIVAEDITEYGGWRYVPADL